MFKVIKPHIKKYLGLIIVYCAAFAAETVLTLYIPVVISRILDRAYAPMNRGLILFFAVSVSCVAASYLRAVLQCHLPNAMSCDLLEDVLMRATREKLEALYKKKRVSDFYAMNNMTFLVPFYYITQILEFIVAVTKAVTVMFIIGRLDWRVAASFLVLTLLQYLANYLILNKKAAAEKKSQVTQNNFQGDLVKMLSEYKHVIAHSMQKRMAVHIGRENRRVFTAFKRANFWGSVERSENALYGKAQYFISVMIVLFMLQNEKISLGSYEIFVSYAAILLSSVEAFFQVLSMRKMAAATYKVYADTVGELEENGDYYDKTIEEISLKDVSFSYDDNPLIEQKSHVFRKGQLYVIVGENGSGKSTLINLMMGLLEPRRGTIEYNGVDIKKWDRYRLLSSCIAVSDQSTRLFFDNLTEEITDDLSIEQIDENAFSHVNQIEGMKELCDRGGTAGFSGGEMQKIGLAKLIYRLYKHQPSILILDEPTNHLDEKNKQLLYQFLEKQRENRIVIVISHAGELIDMADEVVRL